MRLTAVEIAQYLRELQINHELVDHEPAASSDDAFEARRAATGRGIIGAKALVLRVRHRSGTALVLAVLRGHDRLSSSRIRSVLRSRYQRPSVSFASAAEIESDLRGLEPGRVPPLGAPLLPAIEWVVVDERLFGEVEVGFNAADFRCSIILGVGDLERMVPDAHVVADVADCPEDPGQAPPEQMSDRPRFHLAFPVSDLDATAAFYGALGCRAGRTNRVALTLDFFGHQLVAHLTKAMTQQAGIYPRHFGVIVTTSELDVIQTRLARTGIEVERKTRFRGSAIEHDTMLVRDPSGNQLEFKSYATPDAVLGATDDDRIGDT